MTPSSSTPESRPRQGMDYGETEEVQNTVWILFSFHRRKKLRLVALAGNKLLSFPRPNAAKRYFSRIVPLAIKPTALVFPANIRPSRDPSTSLTAAVVRP